jgi:hypothetical protein
MMLIGGEIRIKEHIVPTKLRKMQKRLPDFERPILNDEGMFFMLQMNSPK